jgi:hypothetical protein
VHAEDYDSRLWDNCRNTLGGFDAAQIRHGDIDDGDIGLGGFGLFHRLPSIGGFRNYAEAGLTFEQQAQATAHYGVIVS